MSGAKKGDVRLAYNACIALREDLTDRLAVFRVIPDGQAKGGSQGERAVPQFAAGQHLVLGINDAPAPEGGAVRRMYSMTSPPQEGRWLEFYVRREDGPSNRASFTRLLWEEGEGSRLWAGDRALGRFTIRHTIGEDDPRARIFVAAGAGLAPFVSMVRDCERGRREEGRLFPPCVVVHGASHPPDLAFRAELERILNGAGQGYFPTISQPDAHLEWTGLVGRVEECFEGRKLEELERRMGHEPGFIAPERCAVYVCGLRGTIAQCLTRLLPLGFVPEDKRIRRALKLPEGAASSLFFEQYDAQPILDFNDESLLERLRTSFGQGRGGMKQGMMNDER